ncbi:3'-5' exonuclease, partial [Oleiphilus sp. HI0066]|uniref:3'-5' exonuclease n=1 Tax=Oleiphilus sp. HI0066 TaxID=1822242 RepID=UPI000A4851FB
FGSALRYSEVEALDEEGKALSKADISDSLSLLLASQVCEVLNDKTLGLNSSDLAILVRTKNEARQVKQVLAQVGVKSCFDDDASVFESAEAMSLAFLLEAAQNPTKKRAIRSVLQDPFWQVTDAELSRITEDEFALQTWVDRFQNLQHHWQRFGVLSMVRLAIDEFSILKHWHNAATSQDTVTLDWERSLTNISQLAELLQEKARTLRSESALLRWYWQCIGQTAQPSAEKLATHQLRLESDEALVRIVTIHKSKGLEYPIVFLPFLFTTRDAQQAWFYDEAGRLCLALEPNEQQQTAADRERLAEEMRLLYVALTRAQYHCYIGTAEFSGSRSPKMYSTALGYLLSQGQLSDDLEKGWLQDAISRFTKHTDFSTSYQYLTFEEVHALNRSSRLLIDQSSQSASELSDELFAPQLKQSWKVQSFTGLLNEHRALNPHSEHTHRSMDDLGEAPPANAIDIMNFPKGSQAGTFLHRLFEDIEFATGELNTNVPATNLEEHICNLLQQYALVPERHEQAWAAYLEQWV